MDTEELKTIFGRLNNRIIVLNTSVNDVVSEFNNIVNILLAEITELKTELDGIKNKNNEST